MREVRVSGRTRRRNIPSVRRERRPLNINSRMLLWTAVLAAFLPAAPLPRTVAIGSTRPTPRASAVAMGEPAVVVGGGVSGLSTALELAQRGWDVTVLSRRRDEAASLAAGGMLAPQSERLGGGDDGEGRLLQLALAARDYFPAWVKGLEEAAGTDVGLCASGGFLAPAFADDAVHRWTPPPEAGTSVWLDRIAARAMEPLLSDECVGGWWYPQVREA